ncbi:MAG: SPOR domain-containing protein [Novosphingobium sp.]
MQSGKDRPEGMKEDVDAAAGAAESHVPDRVDPAHEHSELDLDDDDRLPWLESADGDYDDAGVDSARVFGFALAGIAVLAALIGAIWWVGHRTPDPSLIADGSTIAAPSEPYKEAPKNPGGKTFAGTGDTSYAVSQGKETQGHLTGGGTVPKPSVDTGAAVAGHAAPVSAPAAPAVSAGGGIGVQVGAYGSQASAEAGWARLVGQSAALKGVSHRVVEGNADIGKVFRLQAVTGDEAAANALCGKLKAAGVACQVKR